MGEMLSSDHTGEECRISTVAPNADSINADSADVAPRHAREGAVAGGAGPQATAQTRACRDVGDAQHARPARLEDYREDRRYGDGCVE